MSREDVVAVACRVFAIFLLVTVLRSAPSAIALLDNDETQPGLSLVLFVMASTVGLCALLWFFPLSIARKLLPAMKEPRSEAPMNGPVALTVGLTILGVWVLATAVPDAIYWATLFVATSHIANDYFSWTHEQIADIVATITQLIIATWLVFGSSGIKRVIFRFRYGPAQDMA